MERNSQDSQGYKLESQIREAYGRVVYTQTAHDKLVHRLLKRNERIKITQIVLSALTTGTFLATIISDEKLSGIIGAFLSLLLLILSTYALNVNLVEIAEEHKKASNLLWKIREEYVSLLTDFEILDTQQIVEKRDELQNRTADVYKSSPRTDSKSYKETQKALKTQEEQTFSEQEIDIMLPNSIRRSNR
ncbi:SLATT domain-containing protein [Bacillus massilinigeriensis]|uniref:SLATT domain-containing protein n=1 Tax=Bacillus massilionigeriensis TaxID=1805475 RepID=UPI00096B35F9|nr:SLATT domain-containing protein [Bacillus massilionigeriensis]